MTLVLWVFGVCFVVTFGLSLTFYQLGNSKAAILFGLAAWVFIGIEAAVRAWPYGENSTPRVTNGHDVPPPSRQPPNIRIASAAISHVEDGGTPSSRLSLENVGGQPAIDFTAWTGMFLSTPPLGSAGEPQFVRSNRFTEESKMDLPVNTPVEVNGIMGRKLEAVDIIGINLYKLVVYSYTKGRYLDDTGAAYVFEFCLFYKPDDPTRLAACGTRNSQRREASK